MNRGEVQTLLEQIPEQGAIVSIHSEGVYTGNKIMPGIIIQVTSKRNEIRYELYSDYINGGNESAHDFGYRYVRILTASSGFHQGRITIDGAIVHRCSDCFRISINKECGHCSSVVETVTVEGDPKTDHLEILWKKGLHRTKAGVVRYIHELEDYKLNAIISCYRGEGLNTTILEEILTMRAMKETEGILDQLTP